MKAVLKKVGEPAEVIDVENSLRELQKAVGGNIQTISFGWLLINEASCGKGNMEEANRVKDVILLCDEDGIMKGKEPNFSTSVLGGIVGDVLFVGDGEEDFRSLTDDETESVLKIINRRNSDAV